MPLDLPALDHGCVYGETVYRSNEENGEGEQGQTIDADEDEEMRHGPDCGTEICWQISAVPNHHNACEEVVGED